MIAAGIPALLEPIQKRHDAVQEHGGYPWRRIINTAGTSHGVVDNAGSVVVFGTSGYAVADLIANAPTDTARLLAAVKAVEAEVRAWLASEPIEGAEPSQLWYSVGKKHGAVKLLSAVEAAVGDEA